jgi:hypothetical protein
VYVKDWLGFGMDWWGALHVWVGYLVWIEWVCGIELLCVVMDG